MTNNNDNAFRSPEAELVDPSSKNSRSISKRFFITFLWGLLIYTAIVLLTIPKGDWAVGFVGSATMSLFSGLLAMMIPTKYSAIYVGVGLLAGLTVAYIVGSAAS